MTKTTKECNRPKCATVSP